VIDLGGVTILTGDACVVLAEAVDEQTAEVVSGSAAQGWTQAKAQAREQSREQGRAGGKKGRRQKGKRKLRKGDLKALLGKQPGPLADAVDALAVERGMLHSSIRKAFRKLRRTLHDRGK
jgi:hypothetical protein